MWPGPGSNLYHGNSWLGKDQKDLEQLAFALEGFLIGFRLCTGGVSRENHTLNADWSQIESQKICSCCKRRLKVPHHHELESEHLINGQNSQHDTFEKCLHRDPAGRPCKNLQNCLHCKDTIAIGWNQHIASGIVALIFCVRNCEDLQDLRD